MKLGFKHPRSIDPEMVPGAIAIYRFDGTKNLLKYSQDFGHWAWAKPTVDAGFVANGTIAPNGSMTASNMYETTTATSYNRRITQNTSMTINVPYCFSCYLKRGSRNIGLLAKYESVGGTAWGAFDLDTGIATNKSPLIIYSCEMTPVGDGWYRCWIVYVPTQTSVNNYIYLSDNTGAYEFAGDPANYPDGIYMWGAQLEAGFTPSDYTQNLLLIPNQANAGENGTTDGFEINRGGTIISSSTDVALFGTRSIKVVCLSNNIVYGISLKPMSIVKPNLVYTVSVYMRGTGIVRLYPTQYNITSQYVTENQSPSYTLTNEWVRYSITISIAATCALLRFVVATPVANAAIFYVDGYQLERGSVATEWKPSPGITPSEYFPTTDKQTLIDYSGNGNHGVLGAGSAAPTWNEKGLVFGGNDAVICPIFSNITTGLTIQSVVNKKNNTDQRIISKTEAGGYGFGFNIDTGAMAVLRRNGSYIRVYIDTSDLTGPVGTAMTYDSYNLNVFIGDTLVGTNNTGGGYPISYTYQNSLIVGAKAGGGIGSVVSPYSIMDAYSIMIYPFALTDAQIAQNYACEKARLLLKGITLP